MLSLSGQGNKVAIVGTAPTSKMLAPFNDKSWDIWSCSGGNVDQLPRVNVWFELHPLVEMLSPEMKAVGVPLFKWLKEKSTPADGDTEGTFDVVMLEAGSDNGGKVNTYVPRAIPYPRDDIVQTFGTRNWFTSTVAYMIALAIASGYKEIGLFGVDMAAGQEHYEAQRAACIYWIELARGRGIEVSIPPESCLNAATPMYGYWEGTPFGRRLNATIALVKSSIAQAEAAAQQAQNTKHYFGGALEQLEYFKRTWADGEDMDADLGRFAPLLDGIEQAVSEKLAAIPESPAPSFEGLAFKVPVSGERLFPAGSFLLAGASDATMTKTNWVEQASASPSDSAHDAEFPSERTHLVSAASEGG